MAGLRCNYCKVIISAVVCLALFSARAPAVSAAQPAEDDIVVVEAEGRGATKIEALKAAWMEAVRVGIGMYLTSRTTVIGEDIKEEIVAHSRGQIDSYEELYSEQNDSTHLVLIRAKIRKDILQETAASVQGKSAGVDDNLRVQLVTEQEKKLSGEQLLQAFEVPPLEQFFTLDFKSTQKDGKLAGEFDLKLNMDMYKKVFIDDLCKILDLVAIKKEDVRITDAEILRDIQLLGKNGHAKINTSTYQQYFVRGYRSDKEFAYVIIRTNISTLRIYTINEPTGKILLESIRKNNKFDDADRLQLLITLDALNDNNELVASEIFSSDTHIVYSPICCSDYPYVECRYIYGIAYSNVGIGASAFNKNIYIFPEFSANMGSNKQDDLLNIAFGIVQNGGRYIFNRVHFIAPITSSGSDLDKVSKLEGNFYFKGYGQYAY